MTLRLRIAVADDEFDMREYFARILPRLGHEVVCVAENGRQLVDFCQASPPDLVITDIRMPEMDGIEASMAINSHRPTPVILVSAFHDANLIRRAKDDHVEAYLVKPIKQADLKTAIALSMRRFEQVRAVQQDTPVGPHNPTSQMSQPVPLESQPCSPSDVCEGDHAPARHDARGGEVPGK